MKIVESIKENKIKIYSVLEKFMIIFLFFFIIIFVHRHSLWLDELDWGIGIVEDRNLIEIYCTVLKTGENLPLFYFILYIAKLIFSYNQELLILCTSIIPSIIGLLGLIKISKKFFSEKIKFITICLIFISNAFIVMSAWMLRPYGLLFCFSVWSLYFYLKRLKDESYFNIIKYGICMIFLLYTHWFGSLIALCYAFIDLFLFFRKKVKMKSIISYLIAGIAFLPTFIIMLYFHKGDIADYGITPPEIKAIFYVLLLILNYVKINVLLLIVSIISIIIKNILNRNKKESFFNINIITISFFMLFFSTFFYSIIINPKGSIVRPRYYITVLPHIILIISYNIEAFLNLLKKFKKKWLTIVCIILILILFIYEALISYRYAYLYPNAEGNNDLYEQKIKVLNKQEDIDSDNTLVISSFGRAWIEYYYINQKIGKLPKNIIVVNPLDDPNGAHMAKYKLDKFEYCVKDGKLVKDIPVTDISKYDNIYYIETYRILDDEWLDDESYIIIDFNSKLNIVKIEKNK